MVQARASRTRTALGLPHREVVLEVRVAQAQVVARLLGEIALLVHSSCSRGSWAPSRPPEHVEGDADALARADEGEGAVKHVGGEE